ncbi:MAG TPA: DUF4180 domain-containing protein [Bryobacteraceae bacterium]|jgi:hypothetical protein|nr:DUF4180 domain-containing protein [Bryobacteraceae bacterium]
MTVQHYDLHGSRVVELPAEGPLFESDRDAVDIIATASEYSPEFIVIPAERFGDAFFRLRTRVAGEIIQKFLTYRVRLVIVGDISKYLTESSALRDFVFECNSGSHVWFVSDIEELHQRLKLVRGRT